MGRENIRRPSANPDLNWVNRKAVLWQSAGGSWSNDASKKDAERHCEKKLGHSPENNVGNASPNATNIGHG